MISLSAKFTDSQWAELPHNQKIEETKQSLKRGEATIVQLFDGDQYYIGYRRKDAIPELKEKFPNMVEANLFVLLDCVDDKKCLNKEIAKELLETYPNYGI